MKKSIIIILAVVAILVIWAVSVYNLSLIHILGRQALTT